MSDEKDYSLTIVFPTFNEKKNIEELVPLVQEMFKDVPLKILIVDDNSPDGTAEAGRALNEKYHNVSVLVPEVREGLGAALRKGYNVCDTTFILTSDADQSYLVEDMRALYAKIIDGNHDLVQGSRYSVGGSYEAVDFRVRVKRSLSTLGNRLIIAMTRLPVRDCSANFRIIRRAVWEDLKIDTNTNVMLFELVFKCHHNGYEVTSIPITFKDRIHGDSKLNMASEIPRFIFYSVYYLVRSFFKKLFRASNN